MSFSSLGLAAKRGGQVPDIGPVEMASSTGRSFWDSVRNYFCFTVLAFLALGMLFYAHQNGADFQVYYKAGWRTLQSQEIYQVADGWAPFKYHPIWAVIFSFFSRLPYGLANSVFGITSLLFWGLAAARWARWINYPMSLAAWCMLVLLALNPLSTDIGYGQVNGFLFWAITWLFERTDNTFSNRGFWLNGILAALVVSVKINFALVMVFLLVRQWRMIWGFALGLVILHLSVSFVFAPTSPFTLYHNWLSLLIGQSTDQLDSYEVQGVLRFLRIHYNIATAHRIWLVLLAVAAAAGALGPVLFRKVFENQLRSSREAESTLIDDRPISSRGWRRAWSAAYLFVLIFLFSPLAWWYQILFLYPLGLLLILGPTSKVVKVFSGIVLTLFAVLTYNFLGKTLTIALKQELIFFFGSMALFAVFVASWFSQQVANTLQAKTPPLSSIKISQ